MQSIGHTKNTDIASISAYPFPVLSTPNVWIFSLWSNVHSYPSGSMLTARFTGINPFLFFLFPSFFLVICLKFYPRGTSEYLFLAQESFNSKQTSSTIHHRREYGDKFIGAIQRLRIAQSARELHVGREVVVRVFSFALFFFTSRMRSAWTEHAHFFPTLTFLITTWVATPKSITSGSILEFFWSLYGRPWLIPCGTESWLARTPWVLGFFSGRGKPLVLWGGTGVCPPGKREGGLPELLTVLAVNLKEKYLLDPCVDF